MDRPSPKTVQELLDNIESGWNTFNTYIDTLSEKQLTQPTDAAGWTAKDHLIHLASWEDTLNALLDHAPRWERIGVDKALWDSNAIDDINAIVQKRYQDMPLAEARQKHREVHERLLAKIRQLSDADLQQPIREYQPGSASASPIVRPLVADTYDAYAEHTPWIAAIVEKA
jgi:uncharacterized protein (TIGR03083 family)